MSSRERPRPVACRARARLAHTPVTLTLLIGTLACEPAQIRAPAADPSTNAYVEVADWPRLPAGRTLGRVLGLALDGAGNLWVSQDGEGRPPPPLLVLDPRTGELLREVPLTGIVTPHSLAFDRDGLLWVTDSDSNRIVVMDAQGTIVRRLGLP